MIDNLLSLVRRCLEDDCQLLRAGEYTYKWGKIYRKNIVVFILDSENKVIIPTVNASKSETEALEDWLNSTPDEDSEPEISFRLKMPKDDEKDLSKKTRKSDRNFSESRKIINKSYNSELILNRISNYLNRL